MSYADQPLGQFLDDVAARRPAPSAGAVAAITVAAAAGLVAMAARFSDGFEAAEVTCTRAEALRQRATRLADADAQAYGEVLAAYREARHNGHNGDEGGRVREALTAATEIPLAILDCARQVAAIGVPLATDGNPSLRGDVITAVTLAEAAAVSATQLVRINTRTGNLDDEHVQTAEIWCAEARDTAHQLRGQA